MSQRSERRTPPNFASRRDKKRQTVIARVAELTEKISREKDPLLREMLQKIQMETTLVSKIDPYSERPLDGIEAEFRQRNQALGPSEGGAISMSLLEMAGPRSEDWFHMVEDCLEQKDYALTKYMVSSSSGFRKVSQGLLADYRK